jgi:GNAT superfamily N-acetyltransferase
MKPGSDEIRVGLAREEEIPSLSKLISDLFAIEKDFEPNDEAQCRGLALVMASPLGAVFAAREGETVVGMCSAQLVYSTACGAPSAWVEDVVVAKAQRGRGAGRLLVDFAEAWARDKGAARVQLLVDEGNVGALDFYDAIGFSRSTMRCYRKKVSR